MALLSFKDRITDLAGSLGTADDNALQQWLIDGCYDVMNKSGASSAEFTIQSSPYTGVMTVSLDSVREVMSVERDGIACRPISINKSNYVDPDTVLGSCLLYTSDAADE
mgnify:FL=1